MAACPFPRENAAEEWTICALADLDGDGNSKLTLSFDPAGGERAIVPWFWTDGQGSVLNEAFSQLPGDSGAGDSPSITYMARLGRYAEVISEAWDSAPLMEENLPDMPALAAAFAAVQGRLRHSCYIVGK